MLVLAESDTLATGLLPLCRIGGPKAVGSMGVRRSFRIDGNAMRERNDASSFRSMKIVQRGEAKREDASVYLNVPQI